MQNSSVMIQSSDFQKPVGQSVLPQRLPQTEQRSKKGKKKKADFLKSTTFDYKTHHLIAYINQDFLHTSYVKGGIYQCYTVVSYIK